MNVDDKLYIMEEDGSYRKADKDEWAAWFEDAENRSILDTGIDLLDEKAGAVEVMVSTHFLGLDYNHDTDGPPLLFETVITGAISRGPWRFTSRDQALDWHHECVRTINGVISSPKAATEEKKDAEEEDSSTEGHRKGTPLSRWREATVGKAGLAEEEAYDEGEVGPYPRGQEED